MTDIKSYIKEIKEIMILEQELKNDIKKEKNEISKKYNLTLNQELIIIQEIKKQLKKTPSPSPSPSPSA